MLERVSLLLLQRLVQLYAGLVLYGVSMAMLVRAGLGNLPWDVFHQGVSNRSNLSFGTVSVLTGVAVLLLWIPLREHPGLGTFSNVVVIGVTVDGALGAMPAVDAPLPAVLVAIAAVVLNAVATAAYIGVHFGPGPRDGLMTGLARRTGRSVRSVRTVIEVLVVLVGWALGGTLGVFTVAYALAIGPLVQVFLPLLSIAPVTNASKF